jgi:hypothetical protein
LQDELASCQTFPAGAAANAGIEGVKADIDKAFVRRIVVAQALDGFAGALCVFSTWWSIGFIFAVQINYVIAPRFKPFRWL